MESRQVLVQKLLLASSFAALLELEVISKKAVVICLILINGSLLTVSYRELLTQLNQKWLGSMIINQSITFFDKSRREFIINMINELIYWMLFRERLINSKNHIFVPTFSRNFTLVPNFYFYLF